MEQVQLQQQYKEKVRKMVTIHDSEEDDEKQEKKRMKMQDMMSSNYNQSIEQLNQSSSLINNQKLEEFPHLNKSINNYHHNQDQESSDSSQIISSYNQPAIKSSLPCCCSHSKQCSKQRERSNNNQNNIQQFDELQTHHNTSQSSLNTSSFSCSSTPTFEGLFFTRLPAPSSTSSTRKNIEQISNKSQILYEEQDEDNDEIQSTSYQINNQINQQEQNQYQNYDNSNEEDENSYGDDKENVDEQEEDKEQYEQEDEQQEKEYNQDQYDEQQQEEEQDEQEGEEDDEVYSNDVYGNKSSSDSSNDQLQNLSEIIQQYSHEAKLIAIGSSCKIYSLSVNFGQDMKANNIVLKTSQHNLRFRDNCNAECQKLAKEFFVLQKFQNHPYIIQSYLLENDLYLPLYSAKKQQQYFSINPPSNCCLIMEQATCDLISYFQQKKYETSPHHHFHYLQNKLQSPQYLKNHNLNQQNSIFYQDTEPYLKNSFYNCFSGIFYDILTGLEEVHNTHQLAHNDIKPENMLFFENQSCAKICDFEHCGQRFDLKRTDYTYQSPEIVEIYKNYRDYHKISDSLFEINLFKNDVFSFGVTLFSTMFGFYPFCDELEKNKNDELYSLLISGNSDEFWQEKGIYKICQQIEENTSSTYLYNFKKLIEETLEINPSNRIDTSSLMNHDFFEEERHYRFEKDWLEQQQKLQQSQINNNHSSGKRAISTKNNHKSNSYMNKSQFSFSKVGENENAENIDDYFEKFLSPQMQSEHRNGFIFEEQYNLNMQRSHSFELKFDPKSFTTQQAALLQISSLNYGCHISLQQNVSDQYQFPSNNNQINLNLNENINDGSSQENIIQQKGEQNQTELIKNNSSDIDLNQGMNQQKSINIVKDEFFLDDGDNNDNEEWETIENKLSEIKLIQKEQFNHKNYQNELLDLESFSMKDIS